MMFQINLRVWFSKWRKWRWKIPQKAISGTMYRRGGDPEIYTTAIININNQIGRRNVIVKGSIKIKNNNKIS